MGLATLFSAEGRHYAQAEKLAKKAESYGEAFSKCSDEELKGHTTQYKERLQKGESLESLLPEAFATAREAAKRVLGEYPYPVQILGGTLIHFGDIAEMKTGEGKTLTATMPIYLNALEGKGAHVVTVNEYLAQRDAEWMGAVYRFLGLTVGCNLKDLSGDQKRAVFNCDITYTTNSEVGFDYLRDNMVRQKEERVLRGLHYAVIDEVDSVLIDESRTPLIISGFGESLDQFYLRADDFAKRCTREDLNIVLEDNAVSLNEQGVKKAENFFGYDHLFDGGHADLVHYIQNALRANYLMAKEKEYIVRDDEIILVDQFTGRTMEGREFSNGLHQAIQAKERVGIKEESKTLATITYQNFFRLYDKLSGMTGTAKTEEKEFLDTYNMRVYAIPTNRPVIRVDEPDQVFTTRSEKYAAIVEEVARLYESGQPVLVGTISVGMSESLSAMMKRRGIPHQVLNAKEDAHEAEIVAQAGQRKTVTIATNMAGRGTDIKLGDGVRELGGLVVLGTERHEAQRIDNQLRGRSGRQGDPGRSRFYVCAEDDLMVRFATDLGKEAFEDYGKGKISEDKMRTFVNNIQARAESLHFDGRKNVLEYDDILMEQRRMVYKQRDEILDMDQVTEQVHNLLEKKIKNDWIQASVEQKEQELMTLSCSKEQATQLAQDDSQKVADVLWQNYKTKIQDHQEDVQRWEKNVFLSVLDNQWMDHVDTMDRIKNGIHLRSYAQIKPLDAYKEEAMNRFNNMTDNVRDQVVQIILNVRFVQPTPPEQANQ